MVWENMERHEQEEKDYSINGDEISVNEDDQIISNILKKKISCHSLYGLLLDSHLDCLKMCSGNEGIRCIDTNVAAATQLLHSLSTAESDQLELDQFMEAYCNTLKKLKEALEEPQKESMEFINYMHSQLKELMDNKSSGDSREVR
ncbi:Homeobox protein knotted-1-like 12 [Forsythia ovata]|uniref:Homeobox protein knotted-1-like 12 n=1 Tax=Forsythia ovata TaxID=205694 RepID=A0ABD1P916_9LAMI